MIARKCTRDDLYKALDEVNKKYDDNVDFNRHPEPCGNGWQFTLRVKDSKKAGHRTGFSGRRLVSACWHVHGDFFDELFKISSQATIRARDKTITKESGNWEDSNIGSQMNPLYFSEACECD